MSEKYKSGRPNVKFPRSFMNGLDALIPGPYCAAEPSASPVGADDNVGAEALYESGSERRVSGAVGPAGA